MNAPAPLPAQQPAARAEPPPPPRASQPPPPPPLPLLSTSRTNTVPAPSRLQVAAAVTHYRACTVDPRPGRAVHCPDLNACLVNEGRPVSVDCNAVHFGYAIPVSVVPLPHEPELAELVLEPSPELTPRAVSFLLRHHPQLRSSAEPLSAPAADGDAAPVAAPDASMAAAARPEPLRGRKFAAEPDEDIAAIAKQISDHAEAIYQTWKSRGLAPTEILTCHNNVSAADKFGTALTPSPPAEAHGVGTGSAGRGVGRGQQPQRVVRKTPGAPAPPSSLDLLAQAPSLDANNLEKLVNTFVSEDKARLAAQRHHQQNQQQGKSLPSSIQFALQKFEKQNQSPQAPSPSAKGPTSPYGKPSQPVSPSEPKGAQPSKIPTAVGFPSPHHARSPSLTGSPVSKSPATTPVNSFRPTQSQPSSTRGDTIETILPPDLEVNSTPTKRVTAQSPDSPSGLTTWPLKSKTAAGHPTQTQQQPQPPERQSNGKFATLPANSTAAANQENVAYLAEVAREEERLINALKTGIIIAEESPTTPTTDKSQLFLKKSKEKTAPAKEKTVTNESPVAAHTPHAGLSPSATSVPAKNLPQQQTPELDKANLSSLSMVDFAKARYRSAQARPLTQQRLEDAKQLRAAAGPTSATPTGGGATVGSRGPQEAVAAARSRFQQREGLWPEGEAPLRRTTLKTVPHPELTSAQRQHLRDAAAAGAGQPGQPGANPVRPFLTRGSVAERVLIFEKCPTELLLDKQRAHGHARLEPRTNTPALTTWRAPHEVATKAQTYSRVKENAWPNALPPNTTLQRHVRAHRNVHIPRFYFPKGKPSSDQQQSDQTLQKIIAAFRALPNQQVPRDQFHTITKACDCPLYWKVPLFIAAGGEKLGYVEANSFVEFWKNMCTTCHDPAARFFYILSKGQQHDLTTEEFIPLVQDVVDTHPGLTFLKEATEFHSRYVHTVITRIFYCVNRSWSGKISLPELRRSDLLRIIRLLEEEEDINQVTAYFSYEHFYVIYCKFWELDRDHDLYIDRQDLARHSDHALSTRMIDRIFSGAVTRGGRHNEDKMSYTDFVWFLLSEEDKRHPTAIEYWFRCMDLDGDGYLSMYELEYFYEEQLQRMEAIGIETLPFEDCLCQMLDMIHPAQPGKISLSDLKRCKMTPIFFDTFFNLEKYLDHEQRDPFASQRDHDTEGHELSDWDRYAADEYELLVAEEGGNDQQDDQVFDNSVEDALSPNLDTLVSNGASGPMLDLGEDGCLEDSLSCSWRSKFDGELEEDSDNSADYAADSDECPV